MQRGDVRGERSDRGSAELWRGRRGCGSATVYIGAAEGALIRERLSNGLATESLIVPAAMAALVCHEGEELVPALIDDRA